MVCMSCPALPHLKPAKKRAGQTSPPSEVKLKSLDRLAKVAGWRAASLPAYFLIFIFSFFNRLICLFLHFN